MATVTQPWIINIPIEDAIKTLVRNAQRDGLLPSTLTHFRADIEVDKKEIKLTIEDRNG